MSTVTFQLPANTAPLAAPLLFGYLFNWGLYGVLLVQVYVYYRAFQNDSIAIKCLIYSIFLIETAQTGIATHDAFKTYAEGFGNLSALVSVQTVWLSTPILTGIVSCSVQLYYAYRINVLAGSKRLGLCIALVALLQGSSALATGAQAKQIGNFVDLEAKSFISTSIWLIGSAACDTLIAASMTFFLVRRDTGMEVTHEIVTKLVRLIIETGTLTATTAIVDVILFLSQPKQSYHVCAALALAKMYSNSLLVLFNSRARISRGRGAQSTSDNLYTRYGANRRIHPTLNISSDHSASSTVTGVRVQEESWTETDSIPMSSMVNYKTKSLMEV